jgi:hypothetical protein
MIPSNNSMSTENGMGDAADTQFLRGLSWQLVEALPVKDAEEADEGEQLRRPTDRLHREDDTRQ